MRSRIPSPVLVVAAVALPLVLLLSGCKPPASSGGISDAALADRLEKLPTRPAALAATLDPKTNATKIGSPPLAPVKATAPLPHLPCCSIKDEKSLKVKVTLTRCAPFLEWIAVPVKDLVLAREGGGGGGGGGGAAAGGPVGGQGSLGDVRAFKLNTVDRANVWGTIVCMTSDGPWDATFIEERQCTIPTPHDALYVSGWAGLVGFHWNGGVENHPAEVTVVSCNNVGTTQFNCGISTCDCSSNSCPPGQQCPCPAPW